MDGGLPSPLPPHATLILIDLQRGIDHPSWGERNNPAAEKNVAALLDIWRSSGRLIYHIRHDSHRAGFALPSGPARKRLQA